MVESENARGEIVERQRVFLKATTSQPIVAISSCCDGGAGSRRFRPNPAVRLAMQTRSHPAVVEACSAPYGRDWP